MELNVRRLLAPLRTARYLASHPLTRNATGRAFWRFAKWQIVSRLHRETTHEWIHGTKLVVRRGMTGATGNIYVGLHEFADMMFLLHLLRPEDDFCDIGANVGTYAVLASGVCGARTVAFEPDPATAVDLRKNIDANRLEDKVVVHQVALGAMDAEVSLSRGLGAMNHVVVGHAENCQVVQQRTLDDLLDGRAPFFLKLDVEGYEAAVLRGAERTLGCEKLVALETEGFTPEVQEILGRHGFRRFFYDPFTRSLGETDFGLRANNVLMIRSRREVEERLISAPKIAIWDAPI